MPVERDSEKVTPELIEKKTWFRNWTYAVWLDGAKKIEFLPPILIDDVAQELRVLKGKEPNKFHRICWTAPSLSPAEYALLLERGSPSHVSPSILRTLGSMEILEWLDDISPSYADGSALPAKVEEIRRIFKRNQKLIRRLKKLYKGHCQICWDSNMFKTDAGSYYSEGHHIIPLGEHGYDNLKNVAIVCPLCHKKLHFAEERELLKKKIRYLPKHKTILRTFK